MGRWASHVSSFSQKSTPHVDLVFLSERGRGDRFFLSLRFLRVMWQVRGNLAPVSQAGEPSEGLQSQGVSVSRESQAESSCHPLGPFSSPQG